jgi:hypothetical protein
MITKIAECKVGADNTELEHYFDKSISHDWCGPTVKIKNIELFAEFLIRAVGYSKSGGPLSLSTGVSIIAKVTDEKGRTIEKRSSLESLRERFEEKAYKRGAYLIGWGEEQADIQLNDIGKSLLSGVIAQSPVVY